MEKLIIKRELYKNIMLAGLNSPDEEVCGMLLGKHNGNEWIVEEFHQITNDTKGLPMIDYNMNPQEAMNLLQKTTRFNKNAKLDLVAIWHTHPRGIAVPSSIDVDRVAFPVPYLIYGLGENFIRTWMIDKHAESYTSVITEVIN